MKRPGAHSQILCQCHYYLVECTPRARTNEFGYSYGEDDGNDEIKEKVQGKIEQNEVPVGELSSTKVKEE